MPYSLEAKKSAKLTKLKHTTIATDTQCAALKIGAYCQGQMPKNSSSCALEAGPFRIVLNGTLKENILQAGSSDLIQY